MFKLFYSAAKAKQSLDEVDKSFDRILVLLDEIKEQLKKEAEDES